MNRTSVCMTLFCLSMLVGCGESRVSTYPVSGTVLFDDGSPVRTGTVELSSVEHNLTATGKIGEDGSFILGTYKSNDGACAGNHRVIVMQMIINDGTINHSKDHGQAVDPIFASYNTSPLKVSVNPDNGNPENGNTLKLTVTARDPRR